MGEAEASDRAIDIFKECGELLAKVPPIERYRILRALAIVYDVETMPKAETKGEG